MSEALPFIDSFDHYAGGHVTRKWTSGGGQTTNGGRNNNGWLFGNAVGGIELHKTFGLEYSSFYAGVAYKTQAFGGVPMYFWSVPDAGTGSFAIQHYGDGRLKVTSGSLSSSPSSFVMNIGQWYYLELKGVIVSLGGTSWRFDYEARVNEDTILSGSFTRSMAATFNGKMNILSLTGPGGSSQATIDDVYCVPTGFLGDLFIGVIRPNAEGDENGWTPNAGTVHYNRVNEHDPDDDTTYLLAGTVGLQELHHYEDLGSFPIKVIQTLLCTKKSDAGTGRIQSRLKNGGGTIYTGGQFYPSDLSYLYFREGYELSVFSGVAWTAAEINAMQYGLERTL
jgi:hypothetical protein